VVPVRGGLDFMLDERGAPVLIEVGQVGCGLRATRHKPNTIIPQPLYMNPNSKPFHSKP